MLKKFGYRPDAVAEGREVIQAFEHQDYDLVLMDQDAGDGWDHCQSNDTQTPA